jgi:hypothetical protein
MWMKTDGRGPEEKRKRKDHGERTSRMVGERGLYTFQVVVQVASPGTQVAAGNETSTGFHSPGPHKQANTF